MAVAPHRRLLPIALGAMGVLLAAKVTALVQPPADGAAGPGARLVASAGASEQPQALPPPPRGAAPAVSPSAPPAGGGVPRGGPTAGEPQAAAPPEGRAERDLLQALRARRADLDAREQALAAREAVAEAMEKRASQRLEEAAALARRAAVAAPADADKAERERLERERAEREEAGWRQMVKLYESVRPRDAAAIFDELDLAVLVPLVDRMREAKAAPVLGAMRPERARALTAELARHRGGAGGR